MDPDNRYGVHVYNMNANIWETIRPVKLEPKKLDFVEEEKTLDEKINDYLDLKGVLTPQMREDIRNLIKEHEQE